MRSANFTEYDKTVGNNEVYDNQFPDLYSSSLQGFVPFIGLASLETYFNEEHV